MNNPLILPTVTITQGLQFDGNWQFLSQYPEPDSPIDLTTWTGEFVIAETLGDTPLISMPCALFASGDVTVTLTPEQTAALSPARKIGGRMAAEFQIKLTAPFPEFSQVWQGGVSIARAAE
jgi:hypothetical protein